MTDWVLDSSAVLADMNDEPGGDVARAIRTEACVSAVNAAEVVGKLIELGMAPDEAGARFDLYGCDVIEADGARAIAAGRLHAVTHRTGVSLGDRFCLALAMERGLPVLTGDRRWKTLDLGIEVRLIR